jgi:hypothetical protein
MLNKFFARTRFVVSKCGAVSVLTRHFRRSCPDTLSSYDDYNSVAQCPLAFQRVEFLRADSTVVPCGPNAFEICGTPTPPIPNASLSVL